LIDGKSTEMSSANLTSFFGYIDYYSQRDSKHIPWFYG